MKAMQILPLLLLTWNLSAQPLLTDSSLSVCYHFQEFQNTSTMEMQKKDSLEAIFENAFKRSLHSNSFSVNTDKSCFLNGAVLSTTYGIGRLRSVMSKLVHGSSPDERLQVFSWDNRTGGSYHTFSNYIRFQPDSGKVQVLYLQDFNTPGKAQPEPGEGDGLAIDASFYEVHQLKSGTITRYVLIGYGTVGSGTHHKVVRIFEDAGNRLTECRHCYPEGKAIEILSGRRQDEELTFDPKSHSLRWKKFVFNEDMGYYTHQFEWKSWTIP